MVKLRLKRIGKKFSAFYRIVAADSRSPRDGRFIEEIGYYNPHTKDLFIDKELCQKWIQQGAQMSDTVKTLWKKTQDQKVEIKKPKIKKTKVVSTKSG